MLVSFRPAFNRNLLTTDARSSCALGCGRHVASISLVDFALFLTPCCWQLMATKHAIVSTAVASVLAFIFLRAQSLRNRRAEAKQTSLVQVRRASAEHNGLKLHPTRALPGALEFDILSFLPEFDVLSLLDTSRDCRTLVERYLATTTRINFTRASVEISKSMELRLMKLTLAHCKRLRSLEVSQDLGPSNDRAFVANWARDIIRANWATLQEFFVLYYEEVSNSLKPLAHGAASALRAARGFHGQRTSVEHCTCAVTWINSASVRWMTSALTTKTLLR